MTTRVHHKYPNRVDSISREPQIVTRSVTLSDTQLSDKSNRLRLTLVLPFLLFFRVYSFKKLPIIWKF